MEITYQGETSFLIDASRTIAINPPTAVKGQIALFSRRKAAERQLVCGPGEYEIGGALIVTLPSGRPGSGLLFHAIDLDGIGVLFVEGEPSQLTETDLLAIGKIDILIISSENIAAAKTMAEDVGARVVLPYGERAAELCAALGVQDIQPATKFTWIGHARASKAVLLKAPGIKRKSKAA